MIIAECKQEVSSFNPVPSHYEDFVAFQGEELLDYHRQNRDEVGGSLGVFGARGDVELVAGLGAGSNA